MNWHSNKHWIYFSVISIVQLVLVSAQLNCTQWRKLNAYNTITYNLWSWWVRGTSQRGAWEWKSLKQHFFKKRGDGSSPLPPSLPAQCTQPHPQKIPGQNMIFLKTAGIVCALLHLKYTFNSILLISGLDHPSSSSSSCSISSSSSRVTSTSLELKKID